MAIIKQQTPYEFLVRWKDGAVAGAHIRFLERIVENGVVISEKEGDAIPVSMAGGAGFPIADILTTLQVTALSNLASEKSAKETSETSLEKAKSDLAESEAQVVTMQAQIDAATPTEPEVEVPISTQQAQSLVRALGSTLGITTAQMDALFVKAAQSQK